MNKENLKKQFNSIKRNIENNKIIDKKLLFEVIGEFDKDFEDRVLDNSQGDYIEDATEDMLIDLDFCINYLLNEEVAFDEWSCGYLVDVVSDLIKIEEYQSLSG